MYSRQKVKIKLGCAKTIVLTHPNLILMTILPRESIFSIVIQLVFVSIKLHPLISDELFLVFFCWVKCTNVI